MMESTDFLRNQIETTFGSGINNGKDIKLLQQQLEEKTQAYIGYNTLRRFFGLLPRTKPNQSTLDIFSKYVGFQDFYDFTHQKRYSDLETTLKLARIKNSNLISKNDTYFIHSLIASEQFTSYFNSMAEYFLHCKNVKCLHQLFTSKIKNIECYQQLQICVHIGTLLRNYYLNDLAFLTQVVQNDCFREVVLYNFVDYDYFNHGYIKLIKTSISIEKNRNHLLFLHLILSHNNFLTKCESNNKMLPFNLKGYKSVHPIVKGRFQLSKLTLINENKIQTKIFQKILKLAKTDNKAEFYFELIPGLILLRRVDLLRKILGQHHVSLFEVNDYNRFTHLAIFQIALCLVYIDEESWPKAKTQFSQININQVFISYDSYIKLFYLIADYHLNTTKKNEVLEEYMNISKATKFQLFSKDFLMNYFA